MDSTSIPTIYEIWMLLNFSRTEIGGKLFINKYDSNPGLSKGDDYRVNNVKVAHKTDSGIKNLTFDFEGKIVDIEKEIDKNNNQVIKFLFESYEREKVRQYADAMRKRNSKLLIK